MQEESVMRYFDYDDIRKLQFPLSPDIFKNITYQVLPPSKISRKYLLTPLLFIYSLSSKNLTAQSRTRSAL